MKLTINCALINRTTILLIKCIYLHNINFNGTLKMFY